MTGTNRFSKAKSYNFHFNKNDVTWPLSANGLSIPFHCHAINTAQKKIENRPVEKAKKMKCYNRLIYKQFFQVSGLCGPQFPSYLPKHFTHHCRLCMETPSLRSKRFQSSYCAKVRAGAKKNPLPLPLPCHSFFCPRPNFLDELARKRLLRRLGDIFVYSFDTQIWPPEIMINDNINIWSSLFL